VKKDAERFQPVALTWYARWCASNPGASFAECRELSAVCRECGADELVSILDAWLASNA
jgi:hypothetical protein